MTKTSPVQKHEADFWSRRYIYEGFIWGAAASPTAKHLMTRLKEKSTVFEVGFGYGRDLAALAEQGHKVSGIEESPIGRANALDLLKKSHNASLLCGDFLAAALPPQKFDAMISHRMLHLLKEYEQIESFVQRAAHIVKPEGLVCISARDTRDLDRNVMNDLGGGVYEYKDRPGHKIRYFDECNFESAFNSHFDIQEFVQESEIESIGRAVPTYFTIMLAKRRVPSDLSP